MLSGGRLREMKSITKLQACRKRGIKRPERNTYADHCACAVWGEGDGGGGGGVLWAVTAVIHMAAHYIAHDALTPAYITHSAQRGLGSSRETSHAA